MRLVFLAPPGAGKGTQGNLVKQDLGIPAISTGDVLREHKSKRTPLGLKARKYMDAGDLVPDSLIIKMLEYEISKDECKNGFILDGFPRSLNQAIKLDQILTNLSHHLDAVIIIEVPAAELISRLSERRSCKVCGKSYHLDYNPPKVAGICDYPCSGVLFQREDDNIGTILNRLKTYESSTKPLLDFYKKSGLARIVDGVGTVNDVYVRIKNLLF